MSVDFVWELSPTASSPEVNLVKRLTLTSCIRGVESWLYILTAKAKKMSETMFNDEFTDTIIELSNEELDCFESWS